jgi:hypothetical protein
MEQPRCRTPDERLLWSEGLDVANQTRVSGEGRKMFLTKPFIDQAFTLIEDCPTWSMSEMAFFANYRSSLCEIDHSSLCGLPHNPQP